MSLLMQLRMLLVSKRWKACAEYAFARATKLDFGSSFGDIDRILKHCLLRTTVCGISFANCFRLDNNSLALINTTKSAEILNELDFTSCSRISEVGLKKLRKDILDKLNRLILTKSGIKSLINFSFPALESLELSQISNPNASFFNIKQPKIRTINLTKANISNLFLENILTHCPNLQHLYLSETSPEVLNVLKLIDQYCPQLKSLDISWIDGVNDNFLSLILQKVLKLEKLEVGNCYDITDTGVISISTFCHHLTSLDISQCFRITQASVGQLINHCPKLEYLNVENCDYITAEILLDIKYRKPNLSIKAKRDTLKKLEILLNKD